MFEIYLVIIIFSIGVDERKVVIAFVGDDDSTAWTGGQPLVCNSIMAVAM
jgi:hypothetical protein